MKEQKIRNGISTKNWIWIWILSLAGQLCWSIENQSFSNYAFHNTGDPRVITWMVALSALATTIASFLFGTLSDRAGTRKKFINIGFILWGVFTIIFGLADFLPKNQITVFAVYVIAMDALMSFCGSIGYCAGVNAWFTDISNTTNRGQVSTITTAMVIIANVICGVGAGLIIDNAGFMPLFVGMGILVIIVGILTMFFLNDSPSLKPEITYPSFWKQFWSAFNFKETFKNHQLVWVLITLCVYTIGFNIFMSYGTIYFVYSLQIASGVELTYFISGVLQAIGMTLGVLISIFAIKPINKGRSYEITLIAVIISVISLILLSYAKSLVGIGLCVFGVALGYVLSLQATTAWYKNLCPEGKRGQLEGVRSVFYVLIPMFIGPLIAQLIIGSQGQSVTTSTGLVRQVPTGSLFLIAGIWTLLTLIPLFVCKKYQNEYLKLISNR